MRISDWSSDVCSSDLLVLDDALDRHFFGATVQPDAHPAAVFAHPPPGLAPAEVGLVRIEAQPHQRQPVAVVRTEMRAIVIVADRPPAPGGRVAAAQAEPQADEAGRGEVGAEQAEATTG